MCEATDWPAVKRLSAAVRERFPVPQWKLS